MDFHIRTSSICLQKYSLLQCLADAILGSIAMMNKTSEIVAQKMQWCFKARVVITG